MQEGTAQIVLKRGEQVLAVGTVSPNAPTVDLLAPNGGEEWDALQTIAWNASDEDEDPLSFSIFYTPDGGRIWLPVASNIQGDFYQVDTSILPGGDEARIRVIATDGFNTTEDDSDETFSVAEKPPEVGIILPQAGSYFSSDEVVSFQGEAADLEDDSIPDTSFIWSYGSTVFGIGRAVNAVLPDGVHEVTLTVVDSDNQTGTSSVTVFIGHRVYLPIISNTSR